MTNLPPGISLPPPPLPDDVFNGDHSEEHFDENEEGDEDKKGPFVSLDDEEEEDDEVEEVHFGGQRDRAPGFIVSEDSDFVDHQSGSESSENVGDASTDLLDEEDEDTMQIVEEENFFWTSPVSGNPMKRFTLNVKDKYKCSIGSCTDSEHYWIDGNEELLTFVQENKKNTPKSFPELLAYDRPEIEIEPDDLEEELD